MSDNPTDNRVQEPTGEDPDGTVDVASHDQEVVDRETQAAADDSVANNDTDHTINKEELIRHRKTFTYDEDEDDLVLVDEEQITPVDTVNDGDWSCTCGETFAQYPGAISHAQNTTDSDEEAENE